MQCLAVPSQPSMLPRLPQEWTSTQPLKSSSLATMKSTNYLLNALVGAHNERGARVVLACPAVRGVTYRPCVPASPPGAAMEAEDRGGSHGIQVDDGKIAEGAVCNVGCAPCRRPAPPRLLFALLLRLAASFHHSQHFAAAPQVRPAAAGRHEGARLAAFRLHPLRLLRAEGLRPRAERPGREGGARAPAEAEGERAGEGRVPPHRAGGGQGRGGRAHQVRGALTALPRPPRRPSGQPRSRARASVAAEGEPPPPAIASSLPLSLSLSRLREATCSLSWSGTAQPSAAGRSAPSRGRSGSSSPWTRRGSPRTPARSSTRRARLAGREPRGGAPLSPGPKGGGGPSPGGGCCCGGEEARWSAGAGAVREIRRGAELGGRRAGGGRRVLRRG